MSLFSRIIAVFFFLYIPASAQVIFSENFEGTVNWTVTGGGWAFGIPTAGPTTVPEGSKCAGTVLNGYYPNYAIYELSTPTITLPDSAAIALSFYEWYALESCCDYMKLELEQNGSGSWITLSSQNGLGTSWNLRTFDLSIYRSSNIRLRFKFTSDGSITNYGWYIDQIRIFSPEMKNLTVNNDGNGSTTPSGTVSIATNSPYSISASPNTGYRFTNWTFKAAAPLSRIQIRNPLL